GRPRWGAPSSDMQKVFGVHAPMPVGRRRFLNSSVTPQSPVVRLFSHSDLASKQNQGRKIAGRPSGGGRRRVQKSRPTKVIRARTPSDFCMSEEAAPTAGAAGVTPAPNKADFLQSGSERVASRCGEIEGADGAAAPGSGRAGGLAGDGGHVAGGPERAAAAGAVALRHRAAGAEES